MRQVPCTFRHLGITPPEEAKEESEEGGTESHQGETVKVRPSEGEGVAMTDKVVHNCKHIDTRSEERDKITGR